MGLITECDFADCAKRILLPEEVTYRLSAIHDHNQNPMWSQYFHYQCVMPYMEAEAGTPIVRESSPVTVALAVRGQPVEVSAALKRGAVWVPEVAPYFASQMYAHGFQIQVD